MDRNAHCRMLERLARLSLGFAAACTVGADEGAPLDAGRDADAPGHEVFIEPRLDDAIADRFAREETEAPPAILYPEDGTLVPPNLAIDLHYTRGFDTVEISFWQGGELVVRVFASCRPVQAGCLFQPWPEVWAALSARRHRGELEVTLRGLARDRVSASSAGVTLELAHEAIDGALYFWTTTPASIRRYDFALGRRGSELFLESGEGTCVGCHAISRDGTRIAVGVHAGGEFTTRVYDVATRAVVPPGELAAPRAAYGAATDLLVSGSPVAHGDAALRIVRATDGVSLHDFELAGSSADWSGDGERIVLEREGELALLARAGGTWNVPSVLETPRTALERAPAFAPHSDWIGYTADLRKALVATEISTGRTELLERARAGHDATWVRFNPQPYLHRGRRIFWFTFSSTRPQGVFAAGPHQIWMAAFEPDADGDPSRPAFRVPAQPAGVANFIAEWTLAVPRLPCAEDRECPGGEFCEEGFCFPEGPE
jgi:TolB protein